MVVLEVIGGIIVIGLIVLGVEKYIEFLRSKAAPAAKSEHDSGE